MQAKTRLERRIFYVFECPKVSTLPIQKLLAPATTDFQNQLDLDI